MAKFIVKTKVSMFVDGEYYDRSLVVTINSDVSNPLEEEEQVNQEFIRAHGVDLIAGGCYYQFRCFKSVRRRYH